MADVMFPFDDENEKKRLSWVRNDIEQRFGFKGGRYTGVNMILTFLIALFTTVVFYTVLFFLLPPGRFTAMFLERGITPYPTVFLGFWTTVILWFKWRKLCYQRKTLNYSILPDDRGFVLTPATVEIVVKKINETTDNPLDFVLYHRIMLTLSNLRNLGRVSDVDDILRSQAEQDENSMEITYNMVNGFLWAIPILGFIGTVLGLSSAIGHFGSVLTADADMSKLIPTLSLVTGGLSTAFETTLIALVIALFLQLITTSLKKSEEEFLDECTEYCTINIVSRLRMEYTDQNEY